MPRIKTTLPGVASREKGQRSLDIPFINRVYPSWMQPNYQKAEFWRWTVRNIPVAMACREALISYMTSLDWKIEPRDSNQRDELKTEIDYYTRLFETGGRPNLVGWDWIKLLESGLQDYLDTPFGFGAETPRAGDRNDGQVQSIIYMDSATLFPTLKDSFPVAQKIVENPVDLVVFPKRAVARMYMSPRPEYRLEGWGMAPPEKLFLALNQVRNGDIYMAKFLVDTPEAGLLDLMDMSQDSATEWITAFKDTFTGIDLFKIPVLYEHDKPAKWIPFGRPPSEILFDKTYHTYVTLVCAAYGLSPSDIGFASKGGGGGETLGGSIRDERKTKRSGVARTKKSAKYFFDRILPEHLQFLWIDLDDEVSVALTRARLANATGWAQYIQQRIFTPKEARLQTIADGLVSIALPEEVDESDFPEEQMPQAQERPGMLGNPVKPSSGGRGEASARSLFSTFVDKYLSVDDIRLRKLAIASTPTLVTEIDTVFRDVDPNLYDEWIVWHDEILWGDLKEKIPELTLSTIVDTGKSISSIVSDEGWLKLVTQDITKFIHDNLELFRNIREDYYVSQSQHDYQFGNSSEYVTSLEPDTAIEKIFKSRLRSVLRDFWKTVPDKVGKSILSGTRNAIIRTGKVQMLDNTENVGDNMYVVPSIREELRKLSVILSNEFDEILIDTISNILEEENTDG